jgi:hypothetical protein
VRREIIDNVDVSKLAALEFPPVPVRLGFPSPARGGPAVSEIRKALASKGRVRLAATDMRVFADVDPGSESPVIALDTLVRSDAVGLERMLVSVLPYVDEIVLGVDERSDEDTRAVARAYADTVWTFGAKDIGLSDEAWAANKIDFAAARNLGRARVRAPWVLVIDSDEFLEQSIDLRQLVCHAHPRVGAFAATVVITEDGVRTFEQRDVHRLARAAYRWHQGTHNQLHIESDVEPPPVDVVIVSDTSLRAADEQRRRTDQRNESIDDLMKEAAGGNMNALFHVVKHKAATAPIEEVVRLAEDFRLRVEPNGPVREQRQWVALAVGERFYRDDDLAEANRWYCRVLLDGPFVPALCRLGDVAEQEGDLRRALRWYQAACAIENDGEIIWHGPTAFRHRRLAGIQRALVDPGSTPMIEVYDQTTAEMRVNPETAETS